MSADQNAHVGGTRLPDSALREIELRKRIEGQLLAVVGRLADAAVSAADIEDAAHLGVAAARIYAVVPKRTR